ncbi:DUF4303 domain-containing protein [Brevibacterium litoralis]|uniref:DUF4303 domain-containing protein n=1 Tax=Brevibacterium litoralis TaxID=3138935 RepID=UPI0032ED1D76
MSEQAHDADDRGARLPGEEHLLGEATRLWHRMIPADEPLAHRVVPRIGGVAVSHMVRGGGTIYVGPDLGALFAASGTPEERAAEVYLSGRRTPIEHFRSARTASVASDDEAWQMEYDLRLGSMEEALRRLDAEGVFGTGEARQEVLLLVATMPPDETEAERGRRMNPPGPLLDAWLAEAAEGA